MRLGAPVEEFLKVTTADRSLPRNGTNTMLADLPPKRIKRLSGIASVAT
jgi:hypothetical protein